MKQKTIQFHNGAGNYKIYINAQEKSRKSNIHGVEKRREVLEKFPFMGTQSLQGKSMSEFSADSFTSYNIWELKYATLSSLGRQPK